MKLFATLTLLVCTLLLLPAKGEAFFRRGFFPVARPGFGAGLALGIGAGVRHNHNAALFNRGIFFQRRLAPQHLFVPGRGFGVGRGYYGGVPAASFAVGASYGQFQQQQFAAPLQQQQYSVTRSFQVQQAPQIYQPPPVTVQQQEFGTANVCQPGIGAAPGPGYDPGIVPQPVLPPAACAPGIGKSFGYRGYR